MLTTEARDTRVTLRGGVSGGVGGGGSRYSSRRTYMSSAVMGTGGPRAPRGRGTFSSLMEGLLALARLIVPVTALLIAFAAAYLYSDTPVTFLDEYFAGSVSVLPSTWLTWGHLLLPTSFLAVHLANRRYGPNYAIAQVVTAVSLVGALGVAEAANSDSVIQVLPTREAFAFGAAFLMALLTAAFAFDRTRGLSWWTAPLFGSLTAALVYTLIFYPLAFFGSSVPFVDYATTHLAVMAAMALLLLIPYWIFRPLVKPLPGFGGY